MLVLTRRLDDMIHVGDVRIKVLKISGNQVSIGIDAPEGVRIVRGELLKGTRSAQYTHTG